MNNQITINDHRPAGDSPAHDWRARLLLGIDGGASKTVALLADANGTILGRAQSGGSNQRALGLNAAIAALDQVMAAVFHAARLPVQPVAVACLGMSGVDQPDAHAHIQAWAEARRLSAALLIDNDARLVIAAGTPDDYGVGIICGTGSIAIGRAPDGRGARAGGWGYLLGDEGSGYDIAIKAVRAATCAADGRGPATGLLPALLEHWELREPYDLIPHVYTRPDPRAHLADLPPLVVRLAEGGDAIAGAILDQAGHNLADAVVAVAEQLALPSPLPLALAGSVIRNAPPLRRALQEALAQRGRPASPITLVEDPARGALRLAGQLLEDTLEQAVPPTPITVVNHNNVNISQT